MNAKTLAGLETENAQLLDSEAADKLTIQSLREKNSTLSQQLSELRQMHFENETKLNYLLAENSSLEQKLTELKPMNVRGKEIEDFGNGVFSFSFVSSSF